MKKRTAGCCLALALTAGAALIIVGVVLLGLISFARSSPGSQPGEASTSTVGVERPAPDFTLPDLNGTQVSLSQFRGQPVVVNFWATWCPPCRDEIPRLTEAYQREKDGVVFIAISDEPADVVGSFVKKNSIPYVNLLDSGDRVSSAYGIRALPTTLFISSEGEIKVYYTGGMSARIIEEGLRRIKEP
jgi:cytochrome c biogenesis protein CcmG/thiol:disulfide interchange protein DsbE